MVRLWRYCQPMPGIIRGMAAGVVPVRGHLPFAGAVADQAAWLLDAFDILTDAYLQLTKGLAET